MKNYLLMAIGLLLAVSGIMLGAYPAIGSLLFLLAICFAMAGELTLAFLLSGLFCGLLSLATVADPFLASAWLGASFIALGLYLAVNYGRKVFVTKD